MSTYLRTVVAPLDEPVSIGDVKLHAHIDHDVDDLTLYNWISSGRKLAEDFQHRAIMLQTLEQTFDDWPENDELCLPYPPLKSLVSIKYYGEDNVEYTLSTTNFIVDTDSEPGRIAFKSGYQWPSVVLREINGLKIRFTAGEADRKNVSPCVKDAIMLYCTYRNENRAGEVVEVPRQFYDLLRSERMYSL